MNLLQMGKTGLCSLALAPLVGASLGGFADSEWPVLIGLAVMLAAVGIFVAAQFVRSRRSFPGQPSFEKRPAREKISTNLVVLSSAAVLAVYSAGYFRTNSAAQQFAEQAALTAPAAARSSLGAPIGALSGAGVRPSVPAASAPRRATGAKPSAARAAAGGSPASSASNQAAPSREASPAAPPAAPEASPAAPAASAAPSATPAPTPSAVARGDAATSSQAAEAQPPAAAPAAPAVAAAPEQIGYKDGVYLGWGFCRHGDIQAQVVVQGGKIVSAEIAQCLTRYPCSVIKEAPGQVVNRQSATVDFVSGATQSGYAFHDAMAQALSKAE